MAGERGAEEEGPEETKGRRRRPSTSPLRVLRNRNFARLFFAGAASIGGFAIGQVALSYFVYDETRSAIDLALMGVAFAIAAVAFSLFAGTLVDRNDRRRVMIICDAVRAACLAVLAVVLFVFGFHLSLILVAAFIIGAFTTIFTPAERALTPSLVGRDELPDANALVQTTSSLALFLSNVAGGGLIVAVGVIAAIGLNSLTFLVSGLLIATIAVRGASVVSSAVESREGSPADSVAATTTAPVAPPRGSFLSETIEGFRYIARTRGLFMLTVSAGVQNFFYAMFSNYFVVYVSEVLHGNAFDYALFVGLFGLGLAPGGILVGRLGAVRRAGLVILVATIVQGFTVVALIFTGDIILAMVTIFVCGLLLGLCFTTWLTVVQLIVPAPMQGRYFGVDQLGSFAIIPVGQVVGGYAIALAGIHWDYGIAGIGLVVTSLAFLASPALRRLGYDRQGSMPPQQPPGPGDLPQGPAGAPGLP